MDLFTQPHLKLPGTPLAERLRPSGPTQILGQDEALAAFRRAKAVGRLTSLILWGPPGTGKTSFASLLAQELGIISISVNAIEIGAKALREIGQQAKDQRIQFQKQTLVFVDEIHRLNKAQQDVLLPFVEKGEFILVGATTENPSYALSRALLSRCQLVVFKSLEHSDLSKILSGASLLLGKQLEQIMEPEALNYLINFADGDARKVLGAFELIAEQLEADNLSRDSSSEVSGNREQVMKLAQVTRLLGKKILSHDRSGDQRYDAISAFIKSIRGSDPGAGLYYLARMLEAGEDPSFIARRLVILASEDVGNADPRGLSVAVAGAQAVEMIGLPEAAINLAQVVTYLASSPKSNRSYLGLKRAQELVRKTGLLEIPKALRSAKTASMRALGYGEGYQYPFESPKHFIEQEYLPAELKRERALYEPSERGFEKQIGDYLKWLKS